MPERQYSEVEVADILRAAAESQAQSMEPGAGGMTLAEIQKLASEVGIDPKHVAVVARTREVKGASKQKLSFWGPPSRVVLDSQVEGALDAAAWDEVVELCRETTRTSGSVVAESWSGGSDILQVNFSFKSNQDSTRFRLIFNQSSIVFLAWALASIFTFTILMVMGKQLHRAGIDPLTVTALSLATVALIHTLVRLSLANWGSKNLASMQQLLQKAGEQTRTPLEKATQVNALEEERLNQQS